MKYIIKVLYYIILCFKLDLGRSYYFPFLFRNFFISYNVIIGSTTACEWIEIIIREEKELEQKKQKE